MAPTELRLMMDPEIGATGVKAYGGILYNSEDYNADLQNQKGMLIYDKMRSSDGEIAGSLSRLTLPLLSAEWRIEPADVSGGEKTAEWVENAIIERPHVQDGHADSFSDFVRHALLMLPFGFMAFEKVWGIDEDGNQIIAKFAPRLPKTFDQFQFLGPNGEFSGARQWVWNPRKKVNEHIVIPAEKLMLFIFGREGDNYWGRSILRAAYKHWDYKDKILWVDAAAHERFGMGALELHATEDISDAEKAEAEETGRTFQSHQQQFLVTPLKWSAIFHHPPAGNSKGVELANYHDQQVSRSMLTEFMATGTAETGSRAVVSTKVDLLMLALKGTANVIEEEINRSIAEMVRRNKGDEEPPRIKCQDLDKMSGTQLAEILKPLTDSKLIVPDKPLREHIRTVLDLPEIDESSQDPIVVAPPFGGGVPGQPPAAGEPAVKKPPVTGQPGDAEKVRKVAPSPVTRLRRDPLPHELHMEAERTAEYLDTEPERIWHRVVRPIRAQQIDAIASYAATLPVSRLAMGIYRSDSTRPRESHMTEQLAEALLGCYRHGREAIVQELRRQKVSKAEGDEAEEDDDDVVETAAQGAWIRRLAAGFSATSIMALLSEAVRAGLNAHQRDLPASAVEIEIRRALEVLSEPVVQAELSGKVAQSYTTGRNDQIVAMRDRFETFFYSAIMDAGTCEACAALDEAEHDFGDPTFQTPNPECEGGIARCRCVTIAVAREEAA